jgi:Spectrin repeat
MRNGNGGEREREREEGVKGLKTEFLFRYNKLNAWIAEKKAYLQKKEEISSVSGAQLQLRLLDAYDKEAASVNATTAAQIVELGNKLAAEQFERTSEARVREAEISASFAELSQLSSQKRPVLEDDLEREKYKEKVRLVNKRHTDQHDKLKVWWID